MTTENKTFTLWAQFEDNSVLTAQHQSLEDAKKDLEDISKSSECEVYTYEINPNT